MIIASPKVTIRNMNQSVREKARMNTFLCQILTDVVDFCTKFSPKIRIDWYEGCRMCAGDCQFFPSALPSYLVQSHKKTAYIYGRHILSSYIFHIFLYLSFHLVQSHKKKQPIYNIYWRHILSSYIFHIFLHLTFYIVQNHKNSLYLYIWTSHTFSIYIFCTFYIIHI